MFYDDKERDDFEMFCTKAELRDLYDEYFTTVINIKADAQSLGYYKTSTWPHRLKLALQKSTLIF